MLDRGVGLELGDDVVHWAAVGGDERRDSPLRHAEAGQNREPASVRTLARVAAAVRDDDLAGDHLRGDVAGDDRRIVTDRLRLVCGDRRCQADEDEEREEGREGSGQNKVAPVRLTRADGQALGLP